MRQLRRERDGGDIAAARERVGRADRPEKFAIEILRIVIAEAARRVLQQGERMNPPLIERERVNERLQGRTGRAGPPRSIDLALDLPFEKSAEPTCASTSMVLKSISIAAAFSIPRWRFWAM